MGKQIDPHLAKAKREIATVEKFLKQGYPPIGIVGSRAGISAVNMASKALKQGRLAFCGRVGSPTCVGLWFKKYKLKPDWSVVIEQGESDLAGQARFGTDDLVIWPANLTSAGHAVGTVIHECLHIIFENQGLGKMKRGKEDREEAIIIGFEVGLVSLFRDNPKLLTWVKRWLR